MPVVSSVVSTDGVAVSPRSATAKDWLLEFCTNAVVAALVSSSPSAGVVAVAAPREGVVNDGEIRSALSSISSYTSFFRWR